MNSWRIPTGWARRSIRFDPVKEKIFAEGMVRVFREDIPILEAQQRNLLSASPKIDITVDAAPLAARRMLDAMLKAQGAG